MRTNIGVTDTFYSPGGPVVYTIDQNNRMRMEIDYEGSEELALWLYDEDGLLRKGLDDMELEFLEYPLCNGWDQVSAEQLGALTSTYFFGTVAGKDWPDKLYTYAKLWWYPDYAIRSFLHDLINKGYCIFDLAVEEYTGYGESAAIMGCL